MRKSFVVMTGRHKGKTLALAKECVVIGRDPESEIRINSTEVSRKHCEVYLRGDHVVVKDLGSRNGTFLNGEAIFSEIKMLPGDTLHVGPMIFELAGKKKQVKKSASEDDVVDWLADEGPADDADTTIVTNKEADEMKTDSDAPLKPRAPAVSIEPIEPGTPAAEAAEVIQGFWSDKNS